MGTCFNLHPFIDFAVHIVVITIPIIQYNEVHFSFVRKWMQLESAHRGEFLILGKLSTSCFVDYWVSLVSSAYILMITNG